jgi:phosphatidate cytidylyltransferase
MLRQRIVTALLMLAVLIPAVFYPSPSAFAAVALILITCAAWEWALLNQLTPSAALVFGAMCASLCVFSWWYGAPQMSLGLVWMAAGGSWVLLAAWLLAAGVSAWAKVPRAMRLVGGLLALWAAWLAVFQARVLGINFLFSVMVLVWAADVFAYFAGRTLGGRFFYRKLAPSISPGKTWEGALGGVIGVVVCALAWQNFDSYQGQNSLSLYSRIANQGQGFLLLALLFLVAMSIVGDLLESLFKRSAGVKDSSGLLPGHGGVLDRIDALLPILPLAMMLVTVQQ